jgi:transposase
MGHPKGQKRDFDALERRRMQALHLFRKGIPQAQIARQLNVARQTVSRWVQQYREGGKAALRKAGRAGRLPKLDSGQLRQLKAMLVVSRLSWKWRERSTAKITERTREETTKALHR